MPKPEPGPRDLLVSVRAVSVNPVDTKIRGAKHQGSASHNTGKPRVLGWDAAGVVVGTGSAVTGFSIGDEVYYAGELERLGSNAEFQAVDERIVGRRPQIDRLRPKPPRSPLTSITAWELLFDRLEISEGEAGSSLLVSGAGGRCGFHSRANRPASSPISPSLAQPLARKPRHGYRKWVPTTSSITANRWPTN